MLYKKYYAEYFKYEAYELNSLWRKAVEEGKKLNIRHVILMTLIIFLLTILIQINKDLYILAIGIMLFPFLVVNLIHLQNIRTFTHFKTRKTDLKGYMEISSTFGLKQTSIVYLNYTILFLVIFILEQSLIILGGTLGLGLFSLRFYLAYRRRVGKEKDLHKEHE
jgi:hypothetical protein